MGDWNSSRTLLRVLRRLGLNVTLIRLAMRCLSVQTKEGEDEGGWKMQRDRAYMALDCFANEGLDSRHGLLFLSVLVCLVHFKEH